MDDSYTVALVDPRHNRDALLGHNRMFTHDAVVGTDVTDPETRGA